MLTICPKGANKLSITYSLHELEVKLEICREEDGGFINCGLN